MVLLFLVTPALCLFILFLSAVCVFGSRFRVLVRVRIICFGVRAGRWYLAHDCGCLGFFAYLRMGDEILFILFFFSPAYVASPFFGCGGI